MRVETLNTDPTAYRVDYSRVVQQLHFLGASKKSPQTDGEKEQGELGLLAKAIAASILVDEANLRIDLADTSERALELVERARGELVRLGWRHPGMEPRWYLRMFLRSNRAEDRRLGRFLDAVLEPATVVVYFSSRIAAGEQVDLFEGEVSGKPVDRKDSPVDPEWLCTYLHCLVSFEAPPSEGRLRPWRDALRWKRPKGINYRARYNVACMFSRLASRDSSMEAKETKDRLELAALQLERCVSEARGRRRRTLIDWASTDPGLEGLRDMDHPRFAAALAPSDPPRDAG